MEVCSRRNRCGDSRKERISRLELQLRHTWTRGISLRGHKNLFLLGKVVRPEGLELSTFWFVASNSKIYRVIPVGCELEGSGKRRLVFTMYKGSRVAPPSQSEHARVER